MKILTFIISMWLITAPPPLQAPPPLSYTEALPPNYISPLSLN